MFSAEQLKAAVTAIDEGLTEAAKGLDEIDILALEMSALSLYVGHQLAPMQPEHQREVLHSLVDKICAAMAFSKPKSRLN